MTTFGPAWTFALLDGAAALDVPPAWVLAVIALESGFDPLAESGAHARGLWQRMPREVARVGRGEPVPSLGPLDFTIAYDDGTTAVMRKYACPAPEVQIRDAFAFWRIMIDDFRVGHVLSREAFYALNLAPARLRGGDYDDDTVMYAAPNAAYRENAKNFGLSPTDAIGAIRIRHLAHGLDAGIARCRARYDAELSAATEMAASRALSAPVDPVAPPDMRDPTLSETGFGEAPGEDIEA